MSSADVLCPFEDCKYFGKIEYVALNKFLEHLHRDHDRYDLIQFAQQMKIIQGPLCFHDFKNIVKKIAEYSKVHKD